MLKEIYKLLLLYCQIGVTTKINDHPEMREIFKAFKIQPVSLLYSVGKKPTKAKELIITNKAI